MKENFRQINEKIDNTNESTRENFRQINEKIDSTNESIKGELRELINVKIEDDGSTQG